MPLGFKRKGKQTPPVVELTEDEIAEMENHIDELLQTQLPIGRVKKICRLDPDISMLNAEAVRLVAKAAELFLIELGKAAFTNCVLERRKTVQVKDVDTCIKTRWMFAFLEDALDDWPKMEPRKRVKAVEGEAELANESVQESAMDDELEVIEEEVQSGDEDHRIPEEDEVDVFAEKIKE